MSVKKNKDKQIYKILCFGFLKGMFKIKDELNDGKCLIII